jgi:hypothetical protein
MLPPAGLDGCLFMSENYFAALKIHCSRQTKLLLETLGGYNTIERGPVSIKVCGGGRFIYYKYFVYYNLPVP